MRLFLSCLSLLSFLTVFWITGCASHDTVHEALKQHPEWIFEAIRENPGEFMEVAGLASQKARQVAQAKAETEGKAKREEEFKNPKQPQIEKGRATRGPASAKVLIVEYSDFQCPYCQRGYDTVEEIRQKYGDRIQFIFKHLPLDFHPMALPAAKRFEAIAMVNPEKAYAFHDAIFKEQARLGTEKEAFLDAVTKKLGLSLAQIKKFEGSQTVRNRIEADKAEAAKYGIQGTPGFIVGGITLAGAYPASAFEEIIERRLK